MLHAGGDRRARRGHHRGIIGPGLGPAAPRCVLRGNILARSPTNPDEADHGDIAFPADTFAAAAASRLSHESVIRSRLIGFLVGMSLTMIAIGMLASYLPARRASVVDPAVSLRTD